MYGRYLAAQFIFVCVRDVAFVEEAIPYAKNITRVGLFGCNSFDVWQVACCSIYEIQSPWSLLLFP